MTVAALPAVVAYVEDGASVSFPVPFRFRSPGDLIVERLLDGDVQLLTRGVDYAVTGGATDAGGTLTRTIATNGAQLRIRRRTARAQPMVYTEGDRFPATSHEEALDRNVLIVQEQDADHADLDARALTAPPGETLPMLPPQRARVGGRKKVIAIDQANGDVVVEELDDAYRGNPGPANNTYKTLADLKASAITNGTANLTAAGLQGAFVWASGEFTGLADDINIIASDVAPLTEGAWVRTGELLAIMGAGDSSPYLRAILNAVPAVRIPWRFAPYRLNSNIRVYSDLTIQADDEVTFDYYGPTVDPSARVGIFWAADAKNIKFLAPPNGNVYFRLPEARDQVYAFYGRAVSHVRLRGLQGINCHQAAILPAREDDGVYTEIGWSQVDTSVVGLNGINQHIDIIGGGSRFDELQAIGQPSVHLVFTFDAKVRRGDYQNCNHAICAWGGDANHMGDGVITNERKSARILVTDCTVQDIRNGGIWFSMTRDSVMRNNTVRRCHDVGLDLEGCINCTVESNLAEDCDQANMSTFFLGRGNVFRNNRSIGAVCLRVYNSALSSQNEDLVVTGNEFSGPIDIFGVAGALGLVTLDYGPVRNLVLTGNRFNNAKCNLVQLNVGSVTATGNVFRLSIPAPAGTRLLSVGGLRNTGFGNGRATVESNQFYAEVSQFPNVEPLYVSMGDFNAGSTASISRNHTRGFSGYDIHAVCDGANPGTTAYFSIRDNNLGHGAILAEATGAGGYVFDRLGNVDVDGNPLDSTSGAYTKGSSPQAVSGATTIILTGADGAPPGILDTATGIVTILVPGFYNVAGQVRLQDGTAPGIRYGVGVGTANVDQPQNIVWQTTSPSVTDNAALTSQGATKTRAMKLNRGDQLRLYVFSPETAINITAASLTLTRVS